MPYAIIRKDIAKCAKDVSDPKSDEPPPSLFANYPSRDDKNYRDFSKVTDDEALCYANSIVSPQRQRFPKQSFPFKLHALITRAEIEGYSNIINWLPHGRAFKIHNEKKLLETVAKKYFYFTVAKSFRRQFSIYGFRKIKTGKDASSYCHELFIRGRPGLCYGILRLNYKPFHDPKKDPDFASFPPLDEEYEDKSTSTTPSSYEAPTNNEQSKSEMKNNKITSMNVLSFHPTQPRIVTLVMSKQEAAATVTLLQVKKNHINTSRK